MPRPASSARATRTKSRNRSGRPTRSSPRSRFKAFGNAVAPDATFTLRLAFGTVKGYEVGRREAAVPHHLRRGVREVRRHSAARSRSTCRSAGSTARTKLDLATPFNFVSTADTIGGNSGSPVLNRAGELVGINFDRNRHGLVRNFVYTDVQARHIAVHSRAVLEALRKLYPAAPLVKELFASG